jgi:hypothetical protein
MTESAPVNLDDSTANAGWLHRPAVSSATPGHWVTLRQRGAAVHVHSRAGDGAITKGPRCLHGCSLYDLHPKPYRRMEHHRPGTTPGGHDAHPTYAEDDAPKRQYPDAAPVALHRAIAESHGVREAADDLARPDANDNEPTVARSTPPGTALSADDVALLARTPPDDDEHDPDADPDQRDGTGEVVDQGDPIDPDVNRAAWS